MTQTEIEKILKAHTAWLQGEADGTRANLIGAEQPRSNVRKFDFSNIKPGSRREAEAYSC